MNLDSRMAIVCLGVILTPQLDGSTAYQYAHGKITIPQASEGERVRGSFSLKRALEYLDQGALAWTRDRKCVSCHTNGSYLFTRPALSTIAGPPAIEIRQFFVDELRGYQEQDEADLRSGITPTQIAYLAGGLAMWDHHLENRLSKETEAAMKLLFKVQSENGAFSNDDGWPPLESSEFHGATVAAMALATAPGWLANNQENPALSEPISRLKAYLRNTRPPHDYARTLLLWTATHLPGLIDEARQDELIDVLWSHQQEDGGWSIRTFAEPERWGRGNRAEKIRAEPDFDTPPSDGHQTGLATLVLLEAGVSKDDSRIQRAVTWLLTNQRESGRWWTRSLNTDKYHFITYSGTCYPLLALAKAGVLNP